MGEDTMPEAPGPRATVEEAPALRVIEAFGGIRPMAAKLGVAVSTVQGWKARGTIPASRHKDVRAAAGAHGVTLDAADPAGRAPEEAEKAGDPEPAPSPDEATPAEAAPRQAERRGGWLPGFLAGALVLAAGVGGGVLTRDLWAPPPAGGNGAATKYLAELESRLSALEGRPSGVEPRSLEGLASAEEVERLSDALADIDSRIAGLDARVAAPPEGLSGLEARMDTLEAREPAGPADLSEIEGRLDALEAREPAAPVDLSGLEARIEALGARAEAGAETVAALADLRDDLSDLRGKLAATEARLAEADAELASLIAGERTARSAAARQAGAMLDLAQLRDWLRGTAPFAKELVAVRAFAAEDPEMADLLDRLEEHAGSGIPSLEALRRGFPEVARRVVAAGRGEGENDWLGDILRRISDVVSVRPVGEVEGTDPGAIVARAEVRLDEGNLAGALAELKALQGPAEKEADTWSKEAETRLDAEDAVAELTGRIAAALSAGG